MNKTGQNLVMVDFAARDSRSVSAMLRGKGDGREKAWLNFETRNKALFSEEDLQAAFRKASRGNTKRSNQGILGKGFLAVAVLFAVVF